MSHALDRVAKELVSPGRGILAADESFSTIGKRFESIGLESTEPNRRRYREMLFTTPNLNKSISGVILFDETLRQLGANGQRLAEGLVAAGIHPGIKVDTGAKPLAGHANETITEGLDGLAGRLKEYRDLGATFAKWRAVINIDAKMPSFNALHTNAHALARYAALCQEAGIVPIVEPEVLMDGDHDLERCRVVTEETLHLVFHELSLQGIRLEGMLLKPNMVISGKRCPHQATVQQVAEATVATLKRTVPGAVPGIVFLSGGQSSIVATQHLDAMNKIGNLPWSLSFSYGRALQDDALKTWKGDDANLASAQAIFAKRCANNSAAALGQYSLEMEK
ncbi:MAG: fructose-bisphosphate aldolase class I [Acidobacteria bacterium]|nr:fructose-bisphosphate aldolase class I [Acidobacteriota bacterium]